MELAAAGRCPRSGRAAAGPPFNPHSSNRTTVTKDATMPPRASRILLLACLLPAAMLAIPPSRAQAPAGERWALLIGVEQYERSDISRLEFAVKDVKAVASSLARNAGFSDERVQIMTSDVRAAEDPRHPSDTNILVALERLAEKSGRTTPSSSIFRGTDFRKMARPIWGRSTPIPARAPPSNEARCRCRNCRRSWADSGRAR